MTDIDKEVEAMKKAYVDLAISAMTFQEQVMKAFVPVIEAAAGQVQEMMDKINLESLPEDSKERFIATRLKEYEKYWNPETNLYEIDKGNDEAEWICTREELIKDLEKSWEFEHGKSA